MIRLALVGDIHNAWTDADARYFEQSDYDRVIVVGDLSGWRWSGTLEIARALGRMQHPAIVIPGNHDATHAVQMVSEAVGARRVGDAFGSVQSRRYEALREALGPHPLAAYTAHEVGGITLIAGRPHSMGGPELSFRAYLKSGWQVSSLQDSVQRLRALIDASTGDLVFVSHNGPSGLGGEPTDIWGCDFRRDGGDWGDPDMEAAIAYAQHQGRRVLAVCGGHMHRRVRGGGQRVWHVERDGVHYVNAAKVPRIRDGRHHHTEIRIDGDAVTVVDHEVALS